MAQNSYQLINLTANTILNWPFSFQGGAVLNDINNVNASVGPFNVILPDATLAQPGQNVWFNNISLNSFNIVANDGITSIATVAAGAVYFLYLSNNTTPNGTWVATPTNGMASPINSVIAQSSDNSVVITGGALTPPGGMINFQLPTSINNLNSFGNTSNTGFLVVTNSNPLTFATRDFLTDTNISISNPDGIAGDPVIALNPNGISGIASAAIGDLQLSGSVITTNITNGSIGLSSTGTGTVNINGVQVDTNGNIIGANNLTLNGNLTISGSFVSPATPKAIFTFTDTLVPVGNVINQLTGFNISSITGSDGVYTINFITPMASLNYGVTFGLGSTGGSSPFVSHVFYTSKTLSSVSIAIVDASGVLVQSVPNGVTGVIWLPS